MKLSLLVDAPEFWAQLQTDLARARQRVYIQTFTFEGDTVGLALAEQLRQLSGVEVKLSVDDFSRWVVSDRFLCLPPHCFNAQLWAEVRATQQMLHALQHQGVQVKFVNTFGFLFTQFALRNHKKLILIDDEICYIGGINFSEHNFAWHDLMLRVEDAALTRHLTQDFAQAWAGTNRSWAERFDGLTVLALNGRDNEAHFAQVLALIANARESIFVESPYVSLPFCDHLRAAQKRGVPVTIITPGANNWLPLQEHIHQEAAQANFALWAYTGGMTHLKAMLIDRRYLILGSSNFDYLSYTVHEEVMVIIEDAALIHDFEQRVLKKDLAQATRVTPQADFIKTQLLNRLFRGLAKALAHLSRWGQPSIGSA